METFQDYLKALEEARSAASQLPLGGWQWRDRPTAGSDAPVVLVFSPHPDDECMIGALPLRMLREAGARIVNVAVTLGSDLGMRATRLEELKGACEYLGFDMATAGPQGLDLVRILTRREKPAHWFSMVKALESFIHELQPLVVMHPHAADNHPTHQGVAALVTHALMRQPPDFTCYTVETEYWSPLEDPDLMVGVRRADLADLMSALTFHKSQVERHPYHLSMPMWMMDNARRGAELLGGAGSDGPAFPYATLYRTRLWRDRGRRRYREDPIILPASTPAATLFPPLSEVEPLVKGNDE